MPPALVNREAFGCHLLHPSDIGRPTGPRNPLLQIPLRLVSVSGNHNLSPVHQLFFCAVNCSCLLRCDGLHVFCPVVFLFAADPRA